MSRVTYENIPATVAQEQLRTTHGVRIVSTAEEGESVTALKGGVYGYTYSPGTPAAPLFAVRRYRTFETHKLTSGEVVLIGFTSPETARQFATATEDVTLQLQPDPEPGFDTLTLVPYSRIRSHKQYAAPNQQGFTAVVMPGVPA
jgi:hypothetical protein